MLLPIIAKYLRRNIIFTASAIIFIILFVILSNSFALVLNSSAGQNLDLSNIFKLTLIKGTADLPIIITLTIILAITFTINKLYRDSEIYALHNAGIGNSELFISMLPLLIVVSVINLGISTLILPELKMLGERIIIQNSNTTDFNFIKKNTFQDFKGGNIIIYSSDENDDTTLGETIIYDKNNDTLVLTDNIARTQDVNNKVYALLIQGKKYSGVTGTKSTIAEFDSLHLQIFKEKEKDSVINFDIRSIPTLQLLSNNNQNNRKYQAEFQSRISMSIAIFITALVAIIFAKTKPRAKYNLSILFSLLFFIAYVSILKSSIELIEDGQLPYTFGMYGIHAVVALCAGAWLVIEQKRFG